VTGVLIVFAKRPEPGRVKTRLCPAFTPAQAAALYRAMLADVLEASAAMAAEAGLDAVLAVAPATACAEQARECPPAFRVLAQRTSLTPLRKLFIAWKTWLAA